MEALKVAEHDHPLKLVDLQLEYPHFEEDEEEDGEEESITKEGIHGVRCDWCREEIHMYHRYYYRCTSCDFSLHKFCAELATRSEYPVHRHPLILRWMDVYWSCKICWSINNIADMSCGCSECNFHIHVKCAVEVGKNIIHHPCHPHPLMCANPKPILCECSACGKEQKGSFYQCTSCAGFTIHNDCAFLPKTLLIQETTNNSFNHTHLLTISYSFPEEDQKAKHYPACRVCGKYFFDIRDNWIYKCDKCLYYAHVHCATSATHPAGASQTIKNYKDEDYPGLLHLPFPDESYSIPKHLFFQESGSRLFITTNEEVRLQHISHEHPLILVNAQNESSSSLMCHNPMTKTQLLCNGCLRPIMATMPFYKCDHQHCNFSLHEWCTRLPPEKKDHPAHPQHPLRLLYSNVTPFFFGVFDCEVCRLPCNGFAYSCVKCGYYVDVTCGLMPAEITHKSHPNHLLSIAEGKTRIGASRYNFRFHCKTCRFSMHPAHAFLSPEAIRHNYDKHPMHLSYLPIENHKSDYFCEICEEDLNPHDTFYHCKECAQSVHTACAPSILQSETETYTRNKGCIYNFVNIKFRGIHNTHRHPHPLSFSQGTVLDGQCSMCGKGLRHKMIFKCHICTFAIDYDCCKGPNNI